MIADDESETVYQNSNCVDTFNQHEESRVDVPHSPGPLKDFLARIAEIQKMEIKKQEQDASYQPILRVSIVTARGAPSHKRVINTMRSWDIMVNEAFFMGGVDKAKVLKVMKPHMFFDDQVRHLESSSTVLPSVHVPFGVRNAKGGE